MSNRQRPLLKVLILGDSFVGKTRLLNQNVENTYSPVYKTTIGAECSTKEIDINDRTFKMEVSF